MSLNFEDFENRLNFSFKDKNLLKEALTHRSYINENPDWNTSHNERLEFLGDAVLELVITENLFINYPKQDEGRLTSVRAALVNYQNMAEVAKKLNLDDAILLSKGESKDLGKARDIILANAFEAVLGAMYIDSGYYAASDFIKKNVFVDVEEIFAKNLDKDPKSLLQEIVQEKYKVTPIYKVISENGPDHKKIFRVAVFCDERNIGEGEGLSKQEAEIEAAKRALYDIKTS